MVMPSGRYNHQDTSRSNQNQGVVNPVVLEKQQHSQYCLLHVPIQNTTQTAGDIIRATSTSVFFIYRRVRVVWES